MTRTAVVLPGGQNGPHAPLCTFAADARGARVHHVEWRSAYDPETVPDAGPWVVSQVPPLPDGTLVIGMSLGTHAASVAAERSLPAVWLTPVLTSAEVVDAPRRTRVPMLLVGGTTDPLWNGGLARELSPRVLEVEGADHGMYVPGPLANSAAVLGRVATAVEHFLDEVVWPDQRHTVPSPPVRSPVSWAPYPG